MKTILETNPFFICDIQAHCFQLLSQDEMVLVRTSKTQVLFRKGDNLTKQGARLLVLLQWRRQGCT